LGPAFTVAALALAEGRANAVGAVRLTCAEERLEIELIRVAGYASGFAPGAVAASVQLEVPYTAIRGLVRRGRALCLALDPAACAPHNRFSLARFTDDDAEALASAYRARLRARLASWALPLPLGAIAAAAAPSDLASGPLGVASLAAVVALATWIALRWLLRALTWGGPVSDRYRDALEEELSRRMGFVPAPEAPPLRAAPAPAPPPRVADPPPALLRPRVLVPASLAAIGAVATIAFLQRFGEPVEPPALPEVARVAPAARAIDPARLELGAPEPDLPRCLCQRADSPLWKGGLPILSLLPSAGPEDGGRPMEPMDDRYDFDLAVVNNGAAPLRDVHVLLTFARRNERGERAGITERGLFWEGALRPGRAVKWRVSAPGTEVKVEPGVTGLLDDASGVAPPDAFFELTRARYRTARIHAAMMLAYVRDPRALEALQLLGPPAPTEERTLARIRRAAGEVIACSISAAEGRLRGCVFNGSAAPVRGGALREIPEGETSPTVGARRWAIPATLPVHEGVRIEVPIDQGGAPAEVTVELPERAGSSKGD
jgi:hypothetical protein